MSTDMTEHVAFGFEELAEKITHDRMIYFGYTSEQIAEAEAEDHSRCDWNGDERLCLGEDEKSLHPIADELNATAESVVFVLEYVMRPVAEVRARLAEVEAERDAARKEIDERLWRAAFATNYVPAEELHAAVAARDQAIENGQYWQAEREAWRPVVEAAISVVDTPPRGGWIPPPTDAQLNALIAAVDALPTSPPDAVHG